MRYSWNGVRHVAAVTWLLLVIGPTSTGTGNPAGAVDSQTDSLPAMRDRVRRNGHVTATPTPRSWTSRCPSQCFGNVSAQELKRNYRLNSVKDDILRKLRMNIPPNVTARIPDVPGMQNLMTQIRHNLVASTYSGSDSMEVDHMSPTTFILLSQLVPAERRSNLSGSCYFTFSRDFRNDHIITAQFWVYIRERNLVGHGPQRPGSAPATWILIYRINKSSNGAFEKVLQRRRKIYLTPQYTGRWQSFDAKSLVESWTRNPDRNYGIQIIASDLQGEPLAALPTGNESDDVLRPYIEIQILNQPPNRPRRSNEGDCVEASADPSCCRYPLTIDFDVFHWDWIIAPKRYEAYYCSGECPFLVYQRQTHTHVVRQQAGGLGVPCCSPTLMSSLQMLYIDGNRNIVFGTLPGMIVERCGCS